jgi:hypothetical protein
MPAESPPLMEAAMRLAAIALLVLAAAGAAVVPAADPPSPDGSGRWGIRVAESVQEVDLTPLRDRVSDKARMPARVHPVKDPGGTTTLYVLTAGDFPSSKDAYEARAPLAEKIGLPAASLQIIELPR